jgi:hypothetical protein
MYTILWAFLLRVSLLMLGVSVQSRQAATGCDYGLQADGRLCGGRVTWRAPRRLPSSERDLDATLPARNLLALSYRVPSRIITLSHTRFGLPIMPEGSSSKGKMPVSATAKHADAEGYEMPW